MKPAICFITLCLFSVAFGAQRSFAGYRYYSSGTCSGSVGFVAFDITECSQQQDPNWQGCKQLTNDNMNPNKTYYGMNSGKGACYTVDDADLVNNLAAVLNANYSVGTFAEYTAAGCNNEDLSGLTVFSTVGVCLDTSAADNSTVTSMRLACDGEQLEFDQYSNHICSGGSSSYDYIEGCSAFSDPNNGYYNTYCVDKPTTTSQSSSSSSYSSSSSSSQGSSSSSQGSSSSSQGSSSSSRGSGSSSGGAPSGSPTVDIRYSSCYAAFSQYCDGQSQAYDYGGKCQDLSTASCSNIYSDVSAPVGYETKLDNSRFFLVNTTVDRYGCIYANGVLLSASTMTEVPINGGNKGCQTSTTYCVSTYSCALYACAPNQCTRADGMAIQASLLLILISLSIVFQS